jgi:hypothetical protein
MHINDVYALRAVLKAVQQGEAVNRRTLDALVEATNKEVESFEAWVAVESERDRYKDEGRLETVA